jgi:hypothetical protein
MLNRYKPLRRVSDKQYGKFNGMREQSRMDHEFFTEIWEERDGICDVTGEFLGEALSTMFHHLLPKAKYPQFRYCKWNILLVKPDIHAQIEIDISKVPVAAERLKSVVNSYM